MLVSKIKQRIFRLINERKSLMRHTMEWNELSKLIERNVREEVSPYSMYAVREALSKKINIWFHDMPNIVAIRNMSHNHYVTNKYDDRITMSFTRNNKDFFLSWACTTDPGMFYMQNILNSKGTAILAPGQYVGCYRLGLHQGKYLALIQAKGKVDVFRDANFDDKYDFLNKEHGYFGVNVHKPEIYFNDVDKNSAGCIVFKRTEDFDLFINILLCFKKQTKNTFTITLIESTDF